jgi:hypothetical protein
MTQYSLLGEAWKSVDFYLLPVFIPVLYFVSIISVVYILVCLKNLFVGYIPHNCRVTATG